jgi:hypothetical protein
MPHSTPRFVRSVLLAGLLALCPLLSASDHADPIDPFDLEPEEGGITDLFASPSPDGKDLVLILCVRRALTDQDTVRLRGYEYRINMDLRRSISFENEEYLARYGGEIEHPDEIEETAWLTITFPKGVDHAELKASHLENPDAIRIWSGIRDDPFIFPAFFKTNVVAMVVHVPFSSFPPNQQNWILWATSSKDGKQIDHVGRSLRTQNPRFELLNKLHPSKHVQALIEVDERPSLVRDVLLRLQLDQLVAYRDGWDRVPDVMIYRKSEGVAKFPNGRWLEDDVAKALAEYGDTLLLETSYLRAPWPRRESNDKDFDLAHSPYLADPWVGEKSRMGPSLTPRSRWKLAAIAVGLLGFLVAIGALGWWLGRRRLRRTRYL